MWKDGLNQVSNVLWKRWWLDLRVLLPIPVVLAAESQPPQFPAQKLPNRDWFVDLWGDWIERVGTIRATVEE